METLRARPLFHRWADHVEDTDEDDDKGIAYRGEAALDVIEAFRDDMKTTQLNVGGQGKRKFVVSCETPLNVLMVDELAMLTALSSGATTRRLNQLLAEIMTQGRSTGYSVLAYLQEPTKDIVPIRDLFTRRFSLRTTSASYVDMVLGDGARMRGALADEIPVGDEFAGIGFRVDDRTRNPIRVRAGLVTDPEIDELVHTCTPDAGGGSTVVAFPRAS
jgi:S-DNA-T family DNA segregation ATPase FtsK/SpoIIIE